MHVLVYMHNSDRRVLRRWRELLLTFGINNRRENVTEILYITLIEEVALEESVDLD